MTLSIHEQEPLLTESSQNRSNYVTAKDIDEESLGDNKRVEEHDAEYIVNNRLGNASLFMVTFCLSLSGFLAAVDTSIVTTIFNEIGTEFKSSNLSVWIMTSYMLSTSALQPLYGKLSDIFGRKSTLVAILCFFLIGSGLCGMANSMVQMSIARAIAGLGGGGLMTMASVVIHDLIPMRSRGKYQSYVNMAQTVGTTVGAPLGGFINDYVGWRYCFYLNLPPCFFILYIYVYKLENYNLVRGARARDNLSKKLEQIDFVGAILLLIANLSFVTGASLGGNTHDWNDPVIVALLSSAVSFFFFFGIYEFNWAKHPLVSRSLIKNRNVVAVCLNNFFLCSSTMTFTYLIPQYFMGVLGYSASSAGLWVLPRTAMVAFGCWLAGKYLGVTGRYKNLLVSILVLQVLAAVGTLSWKIDTSIPFRLLCMNVEGFCFGVVLVATMVALVADITHLETASATSMIFLCRSTGWLSGSTVTAAILQSSFKKNLSKRITGPEAADIIEFVRTSITKLRTLAPEIQVVVITSLEQAMHPAIGYGVACSALCFIATLFIRDCQLGSK
ncbi:major facilitator superfamily domain-containing protein [Helicostylum pulchrum]|nr:major facilitator superfamily domain-containing protein [Helicostylum pulchrum]